MVDRVKPCRPVKTKADFYRRFAQGEFGNHGPMWDTYDEWNASDYDGLIAIRTRRCAGGFCVYDLKPREVWTTTSHLLREYSEEELHYSAMAPLDQQLIQGELQLGIHGIEGFVSIRPRCPMRIALREHGLHMSGLHLQQTLKAFLCPTSYEWVQEMLARYQGHVVEFTTFRVPWGVLGWNTVIWEVRQY